MSSTIPLLEAKNISKTFNGVVRALDNVSIKIHEKEIVSVVGENGAGKSTLMKILVGVYSPDSGELYYRGVKVPFPKNPLESLQRGISIVYQEKGVIPHLKVYQYLFFGLEDYFVKFGRLDLGRIFNLTRSIFEELKINVDINKYMYELPLSTRKLIEIARAILCVRCVAGERANSSDFNPIIILDEPTAPLSIEERNELLAHLAEMKKNASFIFVSHIIPEVIAFSDRVYVLRDGKVIAAHNLREEKVDEETLFREIVGREISRYLIPHTVLKEELEKRPVVLSVRNLTKKGYYTNITFDLRKGECLGIFGPAGSGKSEIAKSIYGIISPDSGEIFFHGRPMKLKEDPGVRLSRGIGYFSGETGKELFLYWPIRKNLSIINFEKVSKGPFKAILSLTAEKSLAEKLMRMLRIKAASPEVECYSLSGGNKQKVSVAKWLEKMPEILVLEDPTMGIDVGSREEIYEVLLDMKKNGMSMILVSDDPKEYILLCDKVMYIIGGVQQGIYTIEEFKEMIER